jgi:putative flippase GtrA
VIGASRGEIPNVDGCVLDAAPMTQLLGRIFKFGLTGLAGAGIAYLLFIACLRFMSYVPATVIAWAASIAFGFFTNRRFTFGVRGRARRSRQAVLYAIGSTLQLGLSLLVYAWLFGRLHWTATPAYVANTLVTASFGFVFQSAATFRRRAPPITNPRIDMPPPDGS